MPSCNAKSYWIECEATKCDDFVCDLWGLQDCLLDFALTYNMNSLKLIVITVSQSTRILNRTVDDSQFYTQLKRRRAQESLERRMAFVSNLNNSLNELKGSSLFAVIWVKFLCRCILKATLFIVECCVHFISLDKEEFSFPELKLSLLLHLRKRAEKIK